MPRLLAGRPATDSRPRGRDPVQATFLFNSAQAALAEHDLFNAVRLLHEAVLVDPTYSEAHKAIGECLLSLRRPAEALSHFQDWSRLLPGDRAAPVMIRQVQDIAGGLNLSGYVGNNPVNYTDPLGLKMGISENYTPAARKRVCELLEAIRATKRGAEMLKRLEDDPNRTVVVRPDALDNPRWSPEKDAVYFNPLGQYPLETADGFQVAAPIIVLAHELGHADSPSHAMDEQRNINTNENPIRRELGFPDRVSYDPVPGTRIPSWVEEYQRLRRSMVR